MVVLSFLLGGSCSSSDFGASADDVKAGCGVSLLVPRLPLMQGSSVHLERGSIETLSGPSLQEDDAEIRSSAFDQSLVQRGVFDYNLRISDTTTIVVGSEAFDGVLASPGDSSAIGNNRIVVEKILHNTCVGNLGIDSFQGRHEVSEATLKAC